MKVKPIYKQKRTKRQNPKTHGRNKTKQIKIHKELTRSYSQKKKRTKVTGKKRNNIMRKQKRREESNQ